MRVVAFDLGSRRIGVAVCDSHGRLASPYLTITRGVSVKEDLQRMADVTREARAQHVVVGHPIGLNGKRGRAAQAAEEEASCLRAILVPTGVDVELFDERLTTVSAKRQLTEAGIRGKSRERVVDQAAAAVLLQAWLDTRTGAGVRDES